MKRYLQISINAVVVNGTRILGLLAFVAGSAAWGSWTYLYDDEIPRSYDDGNAFVRKDEDAGLWQYKVTIDDLVSEPYSVWMSYRTKYTLPRPSGTMQGRVWGGWTVSDACRPGTIRVASGTKYEICGVTKLTGIWTVPSIKSAPKPIVKASRSGLLVSWSKISGASYYKIRRGTSKTYSKSKVIAQVSGTRYSDDYPERCPKTKFYYWILPYNALDKGKADPSKYAYGSTKLKSFVISPNIPYDSDYNRYVYVGDKIGFSAKRNGYSFSASKCKWKIVSGGSLASISKKGVLTAKKKGKVVISASYGGKTVKKTVTIRAHSSVDAAIFKEMACCYLWGGYSLRKSGDEYVWDGAFSTGGPCSIDSMSIGAGGIIAISGQIEGWAFSSKGRLGASLNDSGVRKTTAVFDFYDEDYSNLYNITISIRAEKSYGTLWDISLEGIRIY